MVLGKAVVKQLRVEGTALLWATLYGTIFLELKGVLLVGITGDGNRKVGFYQYCHRFWFAYTVRLGIPWKALNHYTKRLVCIHNTSLYKKFKIQKLSGYHHSSQSSTSPTHRELHLGVQIPQPIYIYPLIPQMPLIVLFLGIPLATHVSFHGFYLISQLLEMRLH